MDKKKITVSSFHAWAYSDLFSNITRSVFGEYIVAKALDLDDKPRVEWDKVDLRYKGKGVEVKTAGYIQSWKSEVNNNPSFDIKQTFGWDSKTNEFEKEKRRSADVYVFCICTLTKKDQNQIQNIDNWEFYIVPTKILNEKFGDQKSLSLKKLGTISTPVVYSEIRNKITSSLNP